MAGDMLPNLSLPLLTIIYACGAKPIGGFGLVGPPFTNCYQSSDLSLGRWLEAFTNHYRREEDITHSGRDHVLCGVITD